MFSSTSKSLIVFHILAYLAFFWALITGHWSDWLVSFIIYIVLSTWGGTVTYHRLLSHRSFKTNRFYEYIGSLLGALGGNGSTIGWAAIHREHHRHTDTEKDPHSPYHIGFLKTQFLSMIHKPNLRYIPDLLRDKFHVTLHQYYWVYNLSVVSIIAFFFGINGIIFYYLVPTLLVWHGGSLINTVNHAWGYKNFSVKNSSTNNILTGFLVGGEGWHNNHHAEPANPNFSKRWWEVDIGYQLIRIIRKQ